MTFEKYVAPKESSLDAIMSERDDLRKSIVVVKRANLSKTLMMAESYSWQ